jgi:hypothetical protein
MHDTLETLLQMMSGLHHRPFELQRSSAQPASYRYFSENMVKAPIWNPKMNLITPHPNSLLANALTSTAAQQSITRNPLILNTSISPM